MKAAYVVDTDWVIDYLINREETKRKLKELRRAGLAVSIVSVAELYEGAYYARDPGRSQQVLEAFLRQVPTLGVDREICKIFGKERGRLRQQKKTVSDFDLLIASTCLCYDLTLLSNNRRHYEMVEGLRIVSLS